MWIRLFPRRLATFRPNTVTGSVLSVAPEPAAASVPRDEDPLRKRFDARPLGELESIASKVEYWTQEGKKSAYLTVSFISVDGTLDAAPVRIERPFEFFMPASQRSDGQQWITSSMRLLSMAARAGSSIAKALADMREVAWEKGPVRCRLLTREDGVQAPVYHDSEVAAQFASRGEAGHAAPEAMTAAGAAPAQSAGKCPECGARTLRKVDGCTRCVECHYLGGCG